MVQNLNILSFASYGNLLTERPGGVGLPKGASLGGAAPHCHCAGNLSVPLQ